MTVDRTLLARPRGTMGGVLAVFGTDGGLSIGALVGFATLFGITLRNSIMLLSYFDHLVTVEGMSQGPKAA